MGIKPRKIEPHKPRRIEPQKLKIRNRIMLLYTLLSAILLCILLPTVNFFVVVALDNSMASDMETSMENTAACLYEEDGEVKFDASLLSIESIRSGIYIQVYAENGDLLYQNEEADQIFHYVTEEETKAAAQEDWYSDSKSVSIAGQVITIDAIGSVYYNMFLEEFHSFLWIIVPSYLILAALGSYFLAKRALRSIRSITETARQIRESEWSTRTKNIHSNDEIGELANTFNEMLDEVETSFAREHQFTSDASHELRTPIAVIAACTEEALQTEDAQIRLENLKTIQYENEKMSKMVTQLLLLSRGSEGRAHFEPEDIRLYDMAESVAEELAPEAKIKAITIHNGIPEKISLFADQSLFTNLLMNLIGNAIKYGKEGGHVWLDAAAGSAGVTLTVKDDGIGISQEDAAHVFERFYRADRARDRSGSGLGLAIVKWIVDLHGGDIRVESELNLGSAFIVNMPAQEAR